MAQDKQWSERDVARAIKLAGLPAAPERLETITQELNRSLALSTLLDPFLIPVEPNDVPVTFEPFDPTWPTTSGGRY